ncbi:MAG: hypothetical protein ACREKK_04835 [Candidatus Methylomirabilales bacterium]
MERHYRPVSPRLVLAADPTVEGDGRLLGKPADPATEASRVHPGG